MFVTFEGPEGSGKTTLIRSLEADLRSDGRSVLATREPGAGIVGGEIRQILLHRGSIETLTELFLFLADRSEHVATIIRPALAQGSCVLCDRYGDSTVVYQGYGRSLDLDQLRAWNAAATDGLGPDLTFLLDLEPEVGLARVQHKDRLDLEPLEFHKRIRDGFLAEAAREPTRWAVLDASVPAAGVFDRARRILRERLQLRCP